MTEFPVFCLSHWTDKSPLYITLQHFWPFPRFYSLRNILANSWELLIRVLEAKWRVGVGVRVWECAWEGVGGTKCNASVTLSESVMWPSSEIQRGTLHWAKEPDDETLPCQHRQHLYRWLVASLSSL